MNSRGDAGEGFDETVPLGHPIAGDFLLLLTRFGEVLLGVLLAFLIKPLEVRDDRESFQHRFHRFYLLCWILPR